MKHEKNEKVYSTTEVLNDKENGYFKLNTTHCTTNP